jgi:hypothetical protein
MSERQKLMAGLVVHLARTKTAKELDELFAVAETNEQKATVRLARKLRRENRKQEASDGE